MNRYIKPSTRYMLWGRSAGRCEFHGCNRALSHHPETLEQVNIAEAAHIIGFSDDGPRGEEAIPEEMVNDIDNLMLLCSICHTTIDNNAKAYSVELLRGMKRQHEQRIAVATTIQADRKTHVVMFGASVGENMSPVNWTRVTPALAPDWYPADTHGVLLGMTGSTERDQETTYWSNQERNLRRLVEWRIKALVDAGEIKHLSIFAVAPQPLLVLLGFLVSDLVPAEVYQLHREPATWQWTADGEEGFSFLIERPAVMTGPPALVIGTTDRIDDARVLSVVPNASIWRVTIEKPHNDFLKFRSQLQKFRQVIRPLLDEIKNHHGMTEVIHVFPATSVAIAVEFGRCIQPKINPPLQIYDNISASAGFVPAILIGNP